jgi:hypothetical protein
VDDAGRYLHHLGLELVGVGVKPQHQLLSPIAIGIDAQLVVDQRAAFDRDVALARCRTGVGPLDRRERVLVPAELVGNIDGRPANGVRGLPDRAVVVAPGLDVVPAELLRIVGRAHRARLPDRVDELDIAPVVSVEIEVERPLGPREHAEPQAVARDRQDQIRPTRVPAAGEVEMDAAGLAEPARDQRDRIGTEPGLHLDAARRCDLGRGRHRCIGPRRRHRDRQRALGALDSVEDGAEPVDARVAPR